MAALKKALGAREDQSISTDTLMELAECVLKNNVFEHNGRIFKQKQGTDIRHKNGAPFLFWGDFEERFLGIHSLKPLVW